MSTKSITKRLRVTNSGKVLRRARGLGHSRTNKSSKEMQRKKVQRTITINPKRLNKYL